MSLNYRIDICSSDMDHGDIDVLIDLFDKAIKLGYNDGWPLKVQKISERGSVQISPSVKYPNALFSVSVRDDTEEGKLAKIVRGTSTDVRLSIGEESYHVFFQNYD